MINSILLGLCTLIALGIFANRVWKLWLLLNLGQGNLPTQNIRERIKSVMVNVFGQKSVVKEKSGIGHFFIFWGFIILTFGTTEGFYCRLYSWIHIFLFRTHLSHHEFCSGYYGISGPYSHCHSRLSTQHIEAPSLASTRSTYTRGLCYPWNDSHAHHLLFWSPHN